MSAMAVWFTYLTPALRAFAPLSYFFVALVSLVLVAILVERGVRALRTYRPVEEVPKASIRLGKGVPAYDDTKLREEIAALSKTVKAVIQDYQTVLGNLARIGEKVEKVSGSVADIQTKGEETLAAAHLVRQEISALEKHTGDIRSDLEIVRDDCAKLGKTIEENEKLVRESLYAVSAREQMAELAREIEADADTLYLRFKDGEAYTDREWDEWVNTYHHWERVLKRWIDVSRWYAKDVKTRIQTVEDKEYDGDWTVRDNQFPNADAVRRFKRHRIIQAHWQNVKEEADRGAYLVAFSAQTELEQHGGKFHQP